MSTTVPSPLETTPADARKGRVLVVDDHRNMVASLAISLRNAGFLVTEAVGGEAAVGRLGEDPFDVVVSDLRMDGIDGMQVLKRALEASPATQVIIMTAFG